MQWITATALILTVTWSLTTSQTTRSSETSKTSSSSTSIPGGPPDKRPPLRYGIGSYEYYDDKDRLHVVTYLNDHYGFRVIGDYTPYHPLDGVTVKKGNSTADEEVNDDSSGDSSSSKEDDAALGRSALESAFPQLFQPHSHPEPGIFNRLFPFYTNQSVLEFGKDENNTQDGEEQQYPVPDHQYYQLPPYAHPFAHPPNESFRPQPPPPFYAHIPSPYDVLNDSHNGSVDNSSTFRPLPPFLHAPYPYFHPFNLPGPFLPDGSLNSTLQQDGGDLSSVESKNNDSVRTPLFPQIFYTRPGGNGSGDTSVQPLSDYVKKLLAIPLPDYAQNAGAIDPSLQFPKPPNFNNFALHSSPDSNVTYGVYPLYVGHPFARSSRR